MPDEKADFDVFLSHNSKDKPEVRQIAEALEDRGIRVWLDERELIPGRPWIPALEKIIGTVQTIAAFFGENGAGPWEQPEIEVALIEAVRRGVPVIPVLLPDAPADMKIPLFLQRLTWVNLRGGLSDAGIDSLEFGITGKKPSPKPKPSGPRPPRLHNLPFSSLGNLLKGRDEELRKLQDGAATAITQAETIHGLGGIGKTRLAVEHAWRSGHLYDAAFFVVADSQEKLQSGLANLGRPALLNLPEFRAAQEESVAAVLRWFREHDRWLLILDNVDTKEAEQEVTKIVPALSAGRVLITSRIRNWPATIRRQQIETLGPDEAQRFILERTADDRNQSKDDPDQALRLAEELGGLPLALEQAGAYIAKHQMSLAEYLEEWEKEREKVINWYDGAVMEYPVRLAVTWQKTFEVLRPTAAAILRLTAYLAPDPIPSKMFEEESKIVGEAVSLLCEEAGKPVEECSIKEALAELGSYSMVTRKGESFTVHRMVQDALQTRIPEERRRDWIERSLRLVNDFSPKSPSDVRTWPIWDPLRPHAARIIQYADDAGIAGPTARLISQLALLLLNKSLYREAEPLMWRTLELCEATYGPEHSEVAIRLNNLAQLLKATNRLSEAEPLMRRALQIFEDSLGPNHPNVAVQINNLALLLQATNRLSEAEPLMRRALQIFEDSLGANHPNVAVQINNLAWLLKETNRLAEAEPLMRRALQIFEDSLGANHPNVAVQINNLAQLLQATNRLSEAEPLMRRALQIGEDSFGPQHPSVAIRLNNLAQLLKDTNRLSEAEPLMRRALQIDEDSFGPQHPNVGRDLINLASLFRATNRLPEAEPLMRRALKIDEDSFGSQHPDVATDLHHLAWLLHDKGQLTEAMPLIEQAVKIYESRFGIDHPLTQETQQTLSTFLEEIASQSEPPSSPEGAQA